MLHIRLHQREIQLPRLEHLHIVDRAEGGLRRTADALGAQFAIHHAADGARDGIIDAAQRAGADGDDRLRRPPLPLGLGLGLGGHDDGQRQGAQQRARKAPHGVSSHRITIS